VIQIAERIDSRQLLDSSSSETKSNAPSSFSSSPDNPPSVLLDAYSWRVGSISTISADAFVSFNSSTNSDFGVDSVTDSVRHALAQWVGAPVTDVLVVATKPMSTSLLSSQTSNLFENRVIRVRLEIKSPESAVIVTRMKIDLLRTSETYTERFTTSLLRPTLTSTASVSSDTNMNVKFFVTTVPLTVVLPKLPSTPVGCDRASYVTKIRPTCDALRVACTDSITEATTAKSRQEAMCGSTSSNNMCSQLKACIQRVLKETRCADDTSLATGLAKFQAQCADVDAKLNNLSDTCKARYSHGC
jgi:hypothetical protein